MKLFRGLPLSIALWAAIFIVAANGQSQKTGQPVEGVTIAQGSVVVHTVIISGNTFQSILPANGSRGSVQIENNNATDTCWISYGFISGAAITAGNAVKGDAVELLPGGSIGRYWPLTISEEIVGTCTGTNDTMRVDWQ